MFTRPVRAVSGPSHERSHPAVVVSLIVSTAPFPQQRDSSHKREKQKKFSDSTEARATQPSSNEYKIHPPHTHGVALSTYPVAPALLSRSGSQTPRLTPDRPHPTDRTTGTRRERESERIVR